MHDYGMQYIPIPPQDAIRILRWNGYIPLAIEDAKSEMDGSRYSFIDGLACNKSMRATKGS